jgi:hypothetical protein
VVSVVDLETQYCYYEQKAHFNDVKTTGMKHL